MHALHFKLRDERHPVALDGRVTGSDGHERSTQIDDLTIDGCRITGDFLIGEAVAVTLPGLGTHRGKIRWSLLGKSGVRFEGQA